MENFSRSRAVPGMVPAAHFGVGSDQHPGLTAGGGRRGPRGRSPPASACVT